MTTVVVLRGGVGDGRRVEIPSGEKEGPPVFLKFTMGQTVTEYMRSNLRDAEGRVVMTETRTLNLGTKPKPPRKRASAASPVAGDNVENSARDAGGDR